MVAFGFMVVCGLLLASWVVVVVVVVSCGG